MSLLPSSVEVRAEQEGDPRLIGLDDDATDAVLDAISSETARTVLEHVYDEPRTPSDLATRMETSVQNVSYHLDNLEDAGLVRVADTKYSEKGREMDVYAPAEEPVVMFVGTEERESRFRQFLKRFVGATGLLAVASVLIHALVADGLPYLSFTGAAAGGAGGAGGGGVESALPVATAVFLGGFVVLVALFAWWYWESTLEAALARVRAVPALGGRDPAFSRRAGTAAAGAFVAVVAFWVAVEALSLAIPRIGLFGPAPAVIVVLVGAAAVQAYYNDGLLVSWLVVFGPAAGFGVGVIGTGLAAEGPGAVAGVIGYAVILGAVAALVLGTGGFLVGAVGRRVRSWASRVPPE